MYIQSDGCSVPESIEDEQYDDQFEQERQEAKMNREAIYAEIDAERERQDSIHPSLPKYILHPITDPVRSQFRLSTKSQQEINDTREKTGEHSWYGIMNEEEAEVFSASTTEELYTELIQSIALRVRLAEAIKSGLVKLDCKQ